MYSMVIDGVHNHAVNGARRAALEQRLRADLEEVSSHPLTHVLLVGGD